MNLPRFFLYLLIASVGLSALIGIGVLLFGDFGTIEVRVLFTTLTVTVASIFGLACGAALNAERARFVAIAGIALSIIAALMSFLIIWDVLDDSEIFIKAFVTALILAAACSHLCLLSLARLDRRFAWTRIAAHVSIWLLTAILLYIVWLEPEGDSDLIYRILGILGIFVGSITVITPVLHRLSSTGSNLDALDAEIADLEARLVDLREKKRSIDHSKENK